MATGSVRSDKGIGLAVLFAILAVIGALGMLFAPLPSVVAGEGLTDPIQLTTGWSFALAMIAASLAVFFIHVFEA